MPNSCSRMYSGPISPRRISRTRSVNFTSGSVALARPASDGHGTELRRRILSAAVLVPVALLAVHLGGSALAALMVAAAGTLGWEWARLCGFPAPRPLGLALVAALVAVVDRKSTRLNSSH